MLNHEVVVVGAGLAGMRAALEVAKGADVAVLTKLYPPRSHSGAAQGGINVVLHPDDSLESHIFDTVKGSDYLGDQDAIEVLCREAPRDIYALEHMGTNFTRASSGKLAQRELAGASFPRACYAADLTGHKLLHLLYEQLLKSTIPVYNEWYITSLLVEDGVCRGVLAYDLTRGCLETIRAKAVVLATGGYGRTYDRTTNALCNTGDGMALAFREGTPLADMECVQFHPTTLFGTNILISEAVRGEGGYLLNQEGDRFMRRYVPSKMELAPRDIVSRCIQLEVRDGRGFQDEYVHLDVTHFGEEKIAQKIPQVRDLARRFAGVDVVCQPIPVQPAQHYSLGGIRTNVWGETRIAGLLAAGECGCVSVHGANRLGGNSLLETIVFGRRAGMRALEYASQLRKAKAPSASRISERMKEVAGLLARQGPENIHALKNRLGRTMREKVGVFRVGPEMEQALAEIRTLGERFGQVGLRSRGLIYNVELLAALELQHLLTLAEVITLGALTRRESRGGHARSDYPERDDAHFLKHILAFQEPGRIRQEFEEVSLTRFRPEVRGY
ncbi:MAG: FAD-binding protein [Candidatus Tectomicrobia bacterium]|uniref:succinate dehydrogenase n=1 Tax=Tectimicrobiota bacterium TaxID=2528274 RepID=A0A932G077_UNCTE|nr:FAD-binding protein [Candidatus Tectomicrobia bacterium]